VPRSALGARAADWLPGLRRVAGPRPRLRGIGGSHPQHSELIGARENGCLHPLAHRLVFAWRTTALQRFPLGAAQLDLARQLRGYCLEQVADLAPSESKRSQLLVDLSHALDTLTCRCRRRAR
jgi:hypothetical protein